MQIFISHFIPKNVVAFLEYMAFKSQQSTVMRFQQF